MAPKGIGVSRWWAEYSDRKNDEEDEHVSDSLLYDRWALSVKMSMSCRACMAGCQGCMI